jgi:predicted transposase/invertase (TIGR01784 family)
MAGEHDARYKFLFSNPIFVRRLLESFVREPFVRRLDFSNMQRVATSFVSETFREKESDIIWKIDFAGSPLYLFLLLEFQSTVDHTMPLRFLRYITEFYQSFHGQMVSGKLPAVFPVVLYNGDRHWTVAGNSAELIEKTIPEKYIPSFTYYAVIENEIPKKTLFRIKNALSAVFYAENTAPEEIGSGMDALFSILKDEKFEVVEIFTKWLNDYLDSLGGVEKLDLKKITSLMEAKTMLATKWKDYENKLREQGLVQGREQGLVQGLEQGERRKAVETARKMKAEGLDSTLIRRITGLSVKELEEL